MTLYYTIVSSTIPGHDNLSGISCSRWISLTNSSQVFVLLIAEMAAFFLLVAPIPTSIRHKALLFLANNPVISQIKLGLKFTFFFILILFADSVNRVYRVQQEISAVHEAAGGSGGAAASMMMGVDRNEVQVRKFYSQRNMYLCGFTLFLSHILVRTFALVLELTEAKEQLADETITASTAKLNVTSPSSSKKEDEKEIAELKEIIRQKNLDIEHLKKQADGLSKEYYKISDELNEKAGVVPGVKKLD